MAMNRVTVEGGIKIAVRHPSRCALLLANNLYPLLAEQEWFSKEVCFKFCAYFLANMVDRSIEEEVDPALMERLKGVSLERAVRLLGNDPLPGLKTLIAIVFEALRGQHLSDADFYDFYNELFGKFFPELKLSKTQHASGC